MYVCTLDARKAFDTVPHESLIRKVYLTGIDDNIVRMIDSLYQDVTTKVKWRGRIGQPFQNLQGTRQGGVVSPDLYKVFINDLLTQFESAGLGMYIGDSYIGIPTVADDVTLLTLHTHELQVMIDSASDFAKEEKYALNPTKTDIGNLGHKKPDTTPTWCLDGEELMLKPDVTHLGIQHSGTKSTSKQLAMQKKSLLIRTCYSLIGTGMHGANGLNPQSAYKIYRSYVLPRVMYGLASSVLSSSDTQLLEKAHRRILRELQSLPERTVTSCIYLLIGALPFEALYHLTQLSLLTSVLHSSNSTISNLCLRQSAMKTPKSTSWFTHTSKLLIKYRLPSIHDLMNRTPTREHLKQLFKQKVTEYWSEELMKDCKSRSSLQLLALLPLTSEKLHPLWATVAKNIHDVRRGFIKARIATGTILLQKQQKKFKMVTSAECLLCHTGEEDLHHLLITCPALYEARERYIHQIRRLVCEASSEIWAKMVTDQEIMVQLIVDCTKLPFFGNIDCDWNEIECFSRYFCASLVNTRARLLDEISPDDHRHNTRKVRSKRVASNTRRKQPLPHRKVTSCGATLTVGKYSNQ